MVLHERLNEDFNCHYLSLRPDSRSVGKSPARDFFSSSFLFGAPNGIAFQPLCAPRVSISPQSVYGVRWDNYFSGAPIKCTFLANFGPGHKNKS